MLEYVCCCRCKLLPCAFALWSHFLERSFEYALSSHFKLSLFDKLGNYNIFSPWTQKSLNALRMHRGQSQLVSSFHQKISKAPARAVVLFQSNDPSIHQCAEVILKNLKHSTMLRAPILWKARQCHAACALQGWTASLKAIHTSIDQSESTS